MLYLTIALFRLRPRSARVKFKHLIIMLNLTIALFHRALLSQGQLQAFY